MSEDDDIDELAQWQLDNPPRERNTEQESAQMLCPVCKEKWHGLPKWLHEGAVYCNGEFTAPNELFFERMNKKDPRNR